jgi:hypothetical protein
MSSDNCWGTGIRGAFVFWMERMLPAIGNATNAFGYKFRNPHVQGHFYEIAGILNKPHTPALLLQRLLAVKAVVVRKEQSGLELWRQFLSNSLVARGIPHHYLANDPVRGFFQCRSELISVMFPDSSITSRRGFVQTLMGFFEQLCIRDNNAFNPHTPYVLNFEHAVQMGVVNFRPIVSIKNLWLAMNAPSHKYSLCRLLDWLDKALQLVPPLERIQIIVLLLVTKNLNDRFNCTMDFQPVVAPAVCVMQKILSTLAVQGGNLNGVVVRVQLHANCAEFSVGWSNPNDLIDLMRSLRHSCDMRYPPGRDLPVFPLLSFKGR